MKAKKIFFSFLTISFFLVNPNCFSQEQIRYKKIDTTVLTLKIYKAKNVSTSKKQPAMVFFFGGGWISRKFEQFEPHAKYFSERGITCFLADYRVGNHDKTTPFDALEDAKSAIRFIRANANRFSIDSSKIIAAGGSAGGHLAAATALIKKFDASTDDLELSCIPNTLVLFNPVIDNGPGGYGYDRVKDKFKDFSPLHNIMKDAPPTLIFLGTEDKLIPVETIKYYQTVMKKVGSRCEIYLYKGEEHAFFNYENFKYYKKTVLETDKFLQSLGYLKKYPIIKIN